MSETDTIDDSSEKQEGGGEVATGRPRRRLAPQPPSHLVQSLCQAAFGAELLNPGSELWMAVRRVWNVPLLDNRANAFRHLEPNWPQSYVRILAVLEKLMREGVDVRILTEIDPSNETFAGEFQGVERGSGSGQYREVASWEGIREGVVASSFYLKGGLQLSRNGGLSIAGQELFVYTDEEAVARGRRVFQDQWKK
jgi:hypothetical protein